MLQESVHALGEKHTGLGKVLINAGVREAHDIAGLKQAMQVNNWTHLRVEKCAAMPNVVLLSAGSVRGRCVF